MLEGFVGGFAAGAERKSDKCSTMQYPVNRAVCRIIPAKPFAHIFFEELSCIHFLDLSIKPPGDMIIGDGEVDLSLW
eukprot:9279146-Ditylum_brightwellii.AAC.1